MEGMEGILIFWSRSRVAVTGRDFLVLGSILEVLTFEVE